jgi:hypothetical protein
MINLSVKWTGQLAALNPADMKRVVSQVVSKAGSTALRDMRSEASKRVRAMKRIMGKYISRAITMRRPTAGDRSFALDISGAPIPLVAYPYRQTKQGVSVEVNRGKRTLVKGSFVATLKSGHEGIFQRIGKARLPIKELLGSRPVDALLHRGEAAAVAERGSKSFQDTFKRLLPLAIQSMLENRQWSSLVALAKDGTE